MKQYEKQAFTDFLKEKGISIDNEDDDNLIIKINNKIAFKYNTNHNSLDINKKISKLNINASDSKEPMILFNDLKDFYFSFEYIEKMKKLTEAFSTIVSTVKEDNECGCNDCRNHIPRGYD